tara:strand:- start:849 stop:1103 length:255 start_codon:yes stop_codon:yes gene_type:complete
MRRQLKHIGFSLLIVLIASSCRTKKTFNGVSKLKCSTFEEPNFEEKNKSNTKYKIVILKDGQEIGSGKKSKKGKRGKTRLFKKK